MFHFPYHKSVVYIIETKISNKLHVELGALIFCVTEEKLRYVSSKFEYFSPVIQCSRPFQKVMLNTLAAV